MRQLFVLASLCICIHCLSQTRVETYPADFTERPSINWQFKTNKAVFASPIVDEENVYVGSTDSILYAIQVQSGSPVWKFRTGGEIRSTVLLNGNRIYLISGDGNFYCLDKKNGNEIWRFRTKGEKKYALYSYADYYQSSPVMSDNTIYFGSGDGNLYAVSSETGKLIWNYQTGDVIHTTPAINNEIVYIGSFDGNFYALNSKTGSLVWKFKSVGQRYFPKGEFQGSPAIFNHTVFAGARDYNLYAIDADKGYCRWNKAFPFGWAVAKASFKDSVMYVGTSDDMVLMALNLETGAVKWKAPVKFNIFGSCVFSKKMCYAVTLMGKLFGIDEKTGNITWTWTTEDYEQHKAKYFTEADTYRNDIGAVLGNGGDGFIKMYYDLGAIFSTPCISSDYIIFSSTNGKIYCLKR